MAESMTISLGSKEEKYALLIPQINAVISEEADMIANMANIAAMIQEMFHFWWTGFYRVLDTDRGEQLVLGPFQGPLACTRINKGRGVCGTAWAEEKTQIVPDVDAFPGHIACSSESRSEIVVPVMREGKVIAVLDIDSAELDSFDDTDRQNLEKIVEILVKAC